MSITISVVLDEDMYQALKVQELAMTGKWAFAPTRERGRSKPTQSSIVRDALDAWLQANGTVETRSTLRGETAWQIEARNEAADKANGWTGLAS
ncbi:MAG: hypothetical protein GY925_12875 [Actinomycetia bacterium]|nr:hypothetical protein [Actinomycetes bacterium]